MLRSGNPCVNGPLVHIGSMNCPGGRETGNRPMHGHVDGNWCIALGHLDIGGLPDGVSTFGVLVPRAAVPGREALPISRYSTSFLSSSSSLRFRRLAISWSNSASFICAEVAYCGRRCTVNGIGFGVFGISGDGLALRDNASAQLSRLLSGALVTVRWWPGRLPPTTDRHYSA